MMIMKWNGVTAAQYEQIRKTVNWEGNKPKGAIFHVASLGNNALHVTDIWDSADDFNKFTQERLMPAVMKAGIPGQPVVEMFPVHTTFIADEKKLAGA